MAIVACLYLASVTAAFFGHADWSACMATLGRSRIYETWRLPHFGGLLRQQLAVAWPYALAAAAPALVAITVSTRLRTRILITLFALAPLVPAWQHMSWKWHQCDRKGCTGCEEVELLIWLAVIASLISVVCSLIRRGAGS
jgi:uncharacterized membrane protein YhaH (DUF805 family)